MHIKKNSSQQTDNPVNVAAAALVCSFPPTIERSLFNYAGNRQPAQRKNGMDGYSNSNPFPTTR